jgi:hypothetical protein
MGEVYGTPGELNRALVDGTMPVGTEATMSAQQAAAQLGGLKTINARGFAEGGRGIQRGSDG